jgi:hypothetical protein
LGHPDRRVLRERKKKARQNEKMLGRRSYLDALDLTPYNTVGKIRNPEFTIKYK